MGVRACLDRASILIDCGVRGKRTARVLGYFL
jgi:hypothetical protein